MTTDETRAGPGQPTILAIDDDPAVLSSLARMLRTEELGRVVTCEDPRRAEAQLADADCAAVLLDLVMPHCSGEDLLQRIVQQRPDVPVIVVTATDEADTAIRCMRAGAFDYLVKPVEFSRLVATVSKALRQHALRAENRRLQNMIREPRLRHPERFADIATRSPLMHAVFRHVEAIAPSPEPVLIVGETGVGKELVARALHRGSGRAGEPVSINVAGIDETAFADTLFGHVRGAFTGADRDREGMIEKAGSGTLFLDEIGDLGPEIQTKLLRLLQEGEFFPLGSDKCRRSHCRIIAATNRDLRVGMREGRFRDDLYYRLHTHLVRVPSLRERIGDIPLLVEQFLAEAAGTLDKPVPTIPRELTVHLSAYAFPGNVRELRAMVLDAVARHERGVLSLASFHAHMDKSEHTEPEPESAPAAGIRFGAELPTLQAATRLLVAEALERTEGNQGAAARLLGISRRTVNRYTRETSQNP
jgi:DNA-binding NtrC family response regulator